MRAFLTPIPSGLLCDSVHSLDTSQRKYCRVQLAGLCEPNSSSRFPLLTSTGFLSHAPTRADCTIDLDLHTYNLYPVTHLLYTAVPSYSLHLPHSIRSVPTLLGCTLGSSDNSTAGLAIRTRIESEAVGQSARRSTRDETGSTRRPHPRPRGLCTYREESRSEEEYPRVSTRLLLPALGRSGSLFALPHPDSNSSP